MLGAIILQLVLMMLCAVFACAETALDEVSETKLEKLSVDGDKRAKRALLQLADAPKRLSVIKTALVLTALLGSAYASTYFGELLTVKLIAVGVSGGIGLWRNVSVFAVTLVLACFTTVFGELVPKRLALRDPEKAAVRLSGTVAVASFLLIPLVSLLTVISNAVLRLFGINPNDKGDDVTEEDILTLLDTGSEQGNIDSIENEMIQNIFEFDDISISEVCTHRRDVSFLYKEDGVEAWRELVASTRHNYYPVCGESHDDVIGILSVRRFFRLECDDIESVIREAVDKPFFVPENMKADVLLDQMKRSRNYFAVVIDEYGGTRGVITVHDLLELLVGTLGDKDDVSVEEIRNTAENTWEILGGASIADVEDALEIELSDEDNDTFGGYILGLLGAIPDDGTTLDTETEFIRIHVSSVNDHRIERTTVVKKTEAERAEEARARERANAERELEGKEDQ